ncbi:uncharacterized protein DUF4244 [Leucobacter komagatae]|uniref:Uncharacterized protein DUF4244 n=1 Tax=Leucobacter komagatae TaxID=55969 RepID=A0A542Y900_9MICO|nr:DUF4244 domain-containing protein [Leucobacter komagatae]TQL44551.1 uncharacterized protein DUF4244 [Leucobacter komagatae]
MNSTQQTQQQQSVQQQRRGRVGRVREEKKVLKGMGFPAEPEAPRVTGTRHLEADGHEPVRRSPSAGSARARGGGLGADERGAVTAEYALVIMAAVAFAGLLIVIMRSEEVRAMLLSLVQGALGSAG